MSKNRKSDSIKCMLAVKKLLDEGILEIAEKKVYNTKEIYLQDEKSECMVKLHTVKLS